MEHLSSKTKQAIHFSKGIYKLWRETGLVLSDVYSLFHLWVRNKNGKVLQMQE